MTQHNLTQILKVIRDLVMRNRPCYRDYLGNGQYKTKLLPEYLLPAFLRKNVVASKAEVQSAAAAATAAADAANHAQSTANAAQTTANTAKSTADAAQSTANTAKTTADAALPKTGGTVSGTVNFLEDGTSTTRFMTAINVGTSGSLNAGSYSAVMLNKAGPWFSTNGESLEVGYRSIGSSGSHMRASFRTEVATLSLTNNRSGLSTTFRGDGRIAYNGDIQFNLSRGIIIKSSTADSTKLFRITVDDTGTLTATEVTS